MEAVSTAGWKTSVRMPRLSVNQTLLATPVAVPKPDLSAGRKFSTRPGAPGADEIKVERRALRSEFWILDVAQKPPQFVASAL